MSANDQLPIQDLIAQVKLHENRMKESFSLIPSENILSPLARLCLSSDVYSRYFFEDDRLWGNWAFPGGRNIGAVQEEILIPSMKRLTQAKHVNVRPISGLNGMTLALLNYCKSGDTILCVAGDLGGHASTPHVAERFGIKVDYIEKKGDFDFDEEKLKDKLRKKNVRLIYIDQANVLFPLDVQKIRQCVNDTNSDTLIHADTSHINGLIFGGMAVNPLLAGADSFGGSLHKTFPGPHKAFFATNDDALYKKYVDAAAHLVSHHHAAEMLALTVTALEFEAFGGAEYAQTMVENAQAFAGILHKNGFVVAADKQGYTSTHQVWIANRDGMAGNEASERLAQAGILVNSFGGLPCFAEGGIRIGLNEATKLGMKGDATLKLAEIFTDVALGGDIEANKKKVISLRRKYDYPAYCYYGFEQNLAGLMQNVSVRIQRPTHNFSMPEGFC